MIITYPYRNNLVSFLGAVGMDPAELQSIKQSLESYSREKEEEKRNDRTEGELLLMALRINMVKCFSCTWAPVLDLKAREKEPEHMEPIALEKDREIINFIEENFKLLKDYAIYINHATRRGFIVYSTKKAKAIYNSLDSEKKLFDIETGRLNEIYRALGRGTEPERKSKEKLERQLQKRRLKKWNELRIARQLVELKTDGKEILQK